MGINIDLNITELSQKFYKDFWEPTVKNIWKALWDITEIFPIITWNLMLLLKNKIFQKNLQKYWSKIEDIKDEDRVEIPKEISVPLLKKLTYYDNEKLSDMFLELLAKASDKNQITHVLPKYINIIENLCEDEAILLKYVYDRHINRIPLINFHLWIKWNTDFYVFYEYFTELNYLNLQQNKNIKIYIENLINLWIFKSFDSTYIWWNNGDSIYWDLEKKLRNILYFNIDLESFKWKLATETWKNVDDFIDKIDKQKLELTSLWKDFLNTVFNTKK